MKRVYKYLIENQNEEWYGKRRQWVKDANMAIQFDSENEAVEWIVAKNLLECKVTEHEFVTKKEERQNAE